MIRIGRAHADPSIAFDFTQHGSHALSSPRKAGMNLALQFSNDPRTLSSAKAMLQAALQELPIEEQDFAPLEKFVMEHVREAVEHAYPPGEVGVIELSIKEDHGRLEIRIRDEGIPQDTAALEEDLHHSRRTPPQGVVDEVHWMGFGRDGKALQIIKWLHEADIREGSGSSNLEQFDEAAPLAPEQQYDIRRLRPEEAVQVSQLMYRAYGNTYFNDDVYYPERIAAQNARDANLSYVAVAEDGVVAGHYALELNQPGPVAEGGQAVVDPAHRGRGLLDRMKAAALEAGKNRKLIGWYADAVTVHTFTQKSNIKYGGQLTCIDLAIAPRTERFSKISDVQPQRVTCLLYFHWMEGPSGPRTVSVPERHQEVVGGIYKSLECETTFVKGSRPQGHGTITIVSDPGGGKAFVRAGIIGENTLSQFKQATRRLTEHSHIEVVFAEIPVQDPAAAIIIESLEQEGFGFVGLTPHFAQEGDLLRMAYLVEPLKRDPIQIAREEDAKLVDYALSEQLRVRAALEAE